MSLLTTLQSLSPFARRRERLREEREAERAHQLRLVEQLVHLVESLGEAQSASAEHTSKGLIAIAEANQAQANQFAAWLDSFKITSQPTSSVVSEEDEWLKEQQKFAEKLGVPMQSAEHLPEEFRLAFELQKDFIAGASRD